jgi:hypothetical protein
MSRSSLLIYSHTGDDAALVGQPFRCDAWLGYGDRLFTIAVHVASFAGDVIIESSLADAPGGVETRRGALR